MLTANLKPQGNGFYAGYSAIVGATSAFEAVDDSDDTTHDSAATYITLPRLLTSPTGIVSFPFFLQWEGGVPTSIAVNVVARRSGAVHPQIEIGFHRSGTLVFSGSMFNPGAGFNLATRTFAVDPFNAGAWDPAVLPMTEVCLRSEAGALGSNDVTLISAEVTYRPPRAFSGIRPHAFV